MINEQIRDKEVRVIGEEGQQLGVMSPKDAMKLAREAEVDLVKVAPSAKPPVCKLVDYGKYKYELVRKEKEAKKKQRTIEVKEVRLSRICSLIINSLIVVHLQNQKKWIVRLSTF
jgi:translation initiation factor IF-3